MGCGSSSSQTPILDNTPGNGTVIPKITTTEPTIDEPQIKYRKFDYIRFFLIFEFSN